MKAQTDRVCEVCDRDKPIAGVAASPLGAVSLAYCEECLERDAHPKWLIECSVEVNDGWDNTADWVQKLNYFENGEYRSAKELKN